MKQFELYYYPMCPFCQRVLQILPDVKVEITMKNTMKDPNFHNQLTKGGGKSQVPCLRIVEGDDEQWMYESADIIEYLRAQ